MSYPQTPRNERDNGKWFILPGPSQLLTSPPSKVQEALPPKGPHHPSKPGCDGNPMGSCVLESKSHTARNRLGAHHVHAYSQVSSMPIPFTTTSSVALYALVIQELVHCFLMWEFLPPLLSQVVYSKLQPASGRKIILNMSLQLHIFNPCLLVMTPVLLEMFTTIYPGSGIVVHLHLVTLRPSPFQGKQIQHNQSPILTQSSIPSPSESPLLALQNMLPIPGDRTAHNILEIASEEGSSAKTSPILLLQRCCLSYFSIMCPSLV